jgi:propionyl-CoA carboxylase beta chain
MLVMTARRSRISRSGEKDRWLPKIIRALRLLANKVDTMPRKKHGNIPL